MKINAPPIKSQGIKTRLVPWIGGVAPRGFNGRWIEPFMGTGVVAFNLAPKRALLCDSNPHLIAFYRAVADGGVTPETTREHLQREGDQLLAQGESHYYKLRERFNREHRPLDFLFLNRACFNGMIRFNRRGEFNTPFCRKPRRFARAYITKIANQVAYVGKLLKAKDFAFKCQGFENTIAEGEAGDVIYCDPPYIDRHADYYNGWNGAHEKALFRLLTDTPARFILSTWHHNDFRGNAYIKSLWHRFNIQTAEHFYHLGASEDNRRPMIEAIITNYDAAAREREKRGRQRSILPAERSPRDARAGPWRINL